MDAFLASCVLGGATRERVRQNMPKYLDAFRAARVGHQADLRARVAELDAQEARIVDLYAEGNVGQAALDRKCETIRQERGTAQGLLGRLDADAEEVREQVELALNLTSDVQGAYRLLNDVDRTLLLRSIYTGLFIDRQDEVVDAPVNPELQTVLRLATDVASGAENKTPPPAAADEGADVDVLVPPRRIELLLQA